MSIFREGRSTSVDSESDKDNFLDYNYSSGSSSDDDDEYEYNAGVHNGANQRRVPSVQSLPSSNGKETAGGAGKEHLLSGKSKNLQNLRFRAKKHLVGRIGSRNSLRPLIGQRASACLKAFEDLAKLHIREQAEQKRLFQSVVKSIGKLGVIAKQGNLSEERMETARRLKQELRVIAMVVCTFARMQYSYDRDYLVKQVTSCEQNLRQCVAGLLSDKSTGRLHYIFSVLKSERLLDSVFSPTASSAQRSALIKFVESIEKTLDLSTSTSSGGAPQNNTPQHNGPR